jgi:transcriptional regulator with XRE-family HTH domain
MAEDTKPQHRLAETVIVLRTLRGLTQTELAARSGLSDVYVRQIERGERDIGIGALEKLATALGCEAGELLGSRQGNATIYLLGEAFGAASEQQKRAVLFVLRPEPGEISERRKSLLKLLGDEVEPLTAPVPIPRPRRSARGARAKKPRAKRTRG